MRCLDLFCGGGGAAMGYHRAGFEVVGVDVAPQPDYPFAFVQADALKPPFSMDSFDLIHASPPCQAYIRSGMVAKMVAKDGRHPRLVSPIREMLVMSGVPYVIENVPGAPIRADLVLCGSMFGLGVRRHRLFEIEPPLMILTPPCDHSRPITGVYGHPHGKGGGRGETERSQCCPPISRRGSVRWESIGFRRRRSPRPSRPPTPSTSAVTSSLRGSRHDR